MSFGHSDSSEGKPNIYVTTKVELDSVYEDIRFCEVLPKTSLNLHLRFVYAYQQSV